MKKYFIALVISCSMDINLCSAMDNEKFAAGVQNASPVLSYYDYLVQLRNDYRNQSVDLESAKGGADWFLSFTPPLEVSAEEYYKPTFAFLDFVDELNQIRLNPATSSIYINSYSISDSFYEPYRRYLAQRLIMDNGGIAQEGVAHFNAVLEQLSSTVNKEPLEDLGSSLTKVTPDKNGEITAMEVLEHGLGSVFITWYSINDGVSTEDENRRLTQQFLMEIRRLKKSSVVSPGLHASVGMAGEFVKYFNDCLARDFSLDCQKSNISLSDFITQKLGVDPWALLTNVNLHGLGTAVCGETTVAWDEDFDYREPGQFAKK